MPPKVTIAATRCNRATRPSGTVQKFADVLLDLVRSRGITHLRWLTLQNEPNRTRITMDTYELQYRELDPYIQSIRGQVRYMGGDLVRGPDVGPPNQDAWFQYLAAHMSDILDAYSIHVFWDYWDTQKLVDRLTEVRAIVDALPEAGRKPLYVAEYGVRGLRRFNGLPAGDPGVWEDGTPITTTNVSAFQHAWFDVLAAKLGYLGTSKWDSYFGKYDNGTQGYYFIGDPQNGWPLYPMYNFMQLLTGDVASARRISRQEGARDDRRARHRGRSAQRPQHDARLLRYRRIAAVEAGEPADLERGRRWAGGGEEAHRRRCERRRDDHGSAARGLRPDDDSARLGSGSSATEGAVMYVRVATFEQSEGMDEAIEQVKNDVETDNRPPGLEDAKGMMMLVDRKSGKSIGLVMFETEEALKRGDEALNAMSPGGGSSRSSVEFYEMPVSAFPS